MAGKINSDICLMLSVYKSCHQTVKYGFQINHILQDLAGFEIQISMKTSETENQFKLVFNNRNPVCKINWY